jgi:hypothetical protein
MNDTSTVSSSQPSGAKVFGAIVTVVRNRTGLDYSAAFNRVLADNRDLFQPVLDGPNHTGPLLRLLNRVEIATGLQPCVSTELAADKVAKLTNRFFPSLSGAPTALQWDVLSRTAQQLEKCGVALKIYNRPAASDVSKSDWKSANNRADDVLAFLENVGEKSDDIGAGEKFQKMHPQAKWRTFKGQIDRLVKDEGLSIADAFARLKETQPIFWTQALLSFEPEK